MQETHVLPEDCYSVDTMPDKSQANNKGDVLWYCRQFGWYKGYFIRPVHSGTTHWTFLPDEPQVDVDPKEEREGAFKAWLSQFPADLEGTAIALMKMGFVGGWEDRGKR